MQTKSFLKIRLLSVNFEKFPSINEDRDQSKTSVWRAVVGRGLDLYRSKFLKVNGHSLYTFITNTNKLIDRIYDYT